MVLIKNIIANVKNQKTSNILTYLCQAKEMTDDEIQSECLTFFFGGFETTSTTLAFALNFLATHPHVQKKVQAEIDQFWNQTKEWTSDNILKLPYLDAVLKESMRLYPPGYIFGRESTEAFVLEHPETKEKYWIPKGVTLLINVIGVQRDPNSWKEPDKFIPERWLASEKEFYSPAVNDKFASFPFGAGIHSCAGKKLAYVEQRLILANFLQHFWVEQDEDPMVARVKFVLKPVVSNLRVKRRTS